MSNLSDFVVTSGIKRILTGSATGTGNILIAGEPVNPSKSIVVMTSYISFDDRTGSNGAAGISFSIAPDGGSIQTTFLGSESQQTCTVGYALLEFT